MAYYGDYVNRPQVLAQIRSARGETIDLAVPAGCTVGQLRTFLVQEYDYPQATCLTCGSAVVGDERFVEEFPFGALVIVTPADTRQQLYTPPATHQHQQQQQQSMNLQNTPQYYQTSYQQPHQQQQQQNSYNQGRQTSQTRQHNQHYYNQQHQQQQNRSHQHQEKQSYEKPLSARSQGQQRKQQQQQQEALSNISQTMMPTQEEASASTKQRSRATSNSRPSSGMKTPPRSYGKERRDEPVKSLPRQSSPPMRSPFQTAVSDSDSNANSTRTPPLSSIPIQNLEGGSTSIDTHHASSTAATPMHASRTPRDANNMENRKTPGDSATETSKGPQITINCCAPALKKAIWLELAEDATLGDLILAVVAKEPRLAGSKVIFRGKILNGLDSKLNSFGIRSGAPPTSVISTNPTEAGVYSLYFGSGEYTNPHKTMLAEVEADVASIESVIEKQELTVQQRRGYYEELMRILFRTDDLQDLEGDWRTKRKEMVKKITFLQDKLKVSNDS